MTSLESIERVEPTAALQADAARVLLALTTEFGGLPAPYVTVHAGPYGTVRLGLQLDTPTAFEQWRSALGFDSSEVILGEGSYSRWLRMVGVYMGVDVDLSGFGVAVAADAAVSS